MTRKKRSLTDDQVRSIRAARATGKVTIAELARQHGVSREVVDGLIQGLTYRDVAAAPTATVVDDVSGFRVATAGSSDDRETLIDLIVGMDHDCQALAAAILAAGFTRAQGETVAPREWLCARCHRIVSVDCNGACGCGTKTPRPPAVGRDAILAERDAAICERDEARDQVAAVTNAYDRDDGTTYKVTLLDALKSLRMTQQAFDRMKTERDALAAKLAMIATGCQRHPGTALHPCGICGAPQCCAKCCEDAMELDRLHERAEKAEARAVAAEAKLAESQADNARDLAEVRRFQAAHIVLSQLATALAEIVDGVVYWLNDAHGMPRFAMRDLIEKKRTALAANASASDGWIACSERPAPGDTDLWLWVPSLQRALAGRWREGQWWTNRTRTDPEVFRLDAITHWRPLLAPPLANAKGSA